jgi:hypothetical protein
MYSVNCSKYGVLFGLLFFINRGLGRGLVGCGELDVLYFFMPPYDSAVLYDFVLTGLCQTGLSRCVTSMYNQMFNRMFPSTVLSSL